MPTFDYQGRNDEGKAVVGQLEGASVDAIAGQLMGRGITPVGITETNESISISEWWADARASKVVETVDLIMFCRQMYTVTKAGIPLMKGIKGLAASMTHKYFQQALEDIEASLGTGMGLSVSMRKHPDIFNHLFISLVQVGESTGKLDEVFLQLSQYLERDMATSKSIASALRYPSFVMGALVVAMVVINIFVIPVFAKMFSKFGSELPLATRILIGTSDFFVAYWLYMLVAIALGGYLGHNYLKSDVGSKKWGHKKLSMPLVGSIIQRASMARYARSFALMLRAGVPLTQALDLCSNTIDNPYLSEKILNIKTGIERGESLFHTHNSSNMFTPLVLQMISVGEESGQVDTLLTEVAEFYEREVDYDVESLGAKIEPIMLVAMAGFVLVLALGIFQPMWGMASAQGL